MYKWNLFIVVLFPQLITFCCGSLRKLSTAGPPHRIEAQDREGLTDSLSVVQPTDEPLTPPVTKRPRVSSFWFFPHHDISTAFKVAEEVRSAARPATPMIFKDAQMGSPTKNQLLVLEGTALANIENRIIKVMSTTHTLEFEQAPPHSQPASGTSTPILMDENVYYRILKQMSVGQNKEVAQVNPADAQRQYHSKFPELGPQREPQPANVVEIRDGELVLLRHHLQPPIQTLSKYVTYLTQLDSTVRKSRKFLQDLLDWNLGPSHCLQTYGNKAELRARKYLSSYPQSHRWGSLPSWSIHNVDSFAKMAHKLSMQVGIERCKLLKIQLHIEQATSEMSLRESVYMQKAGLRESSKKHNTRAGEDCITYSLMGFITILYAVFTPFDSKTILEMRGRLMALVEDLKGIYLYLRLGDSAKYVHEIKDKKALSFIIFLEDSLARKRKSLHFNIDSMICEVFSWWCYQRNPVVFSFLNHATSNAQTRAAFLILLKDFNLVNWIESS